MSNHITEEELRDSLLSLRFKTMATTFIIGENGKHIDVYALNHIQVRKVLKVVHDYTNSEVTAVLERLEAKKGVIATGYDGKVKTQFTEVVSMSAIQQEKERLLK